MNSPFNALTMAQEQIDGLDQQLLKRTVRVTDTPCDTQAQVAGRNLKAFCSNDYLGLANHPDLVAALAEGGKLYGVGSGASHLISGHSIAHELLEKKFASLKRTV
jgi:8-amino-7-oxononanoate synthase